MRLSNISHGRRPGTVTIIVVSFLALLLIMGMTFAFYGLREAEEAKVYRDSANGGQTGVGPTVRGSSNQDQPPEPDVILNHALGSLVFGAPDDLTGAFNVLRQHEIARSAFGWNPKFQSPYYPYNDGGVALPGFNARYAATQPFNGMGRVSPQVIGSTQLPIVTLPDNMINFTWPTDSLALMTAFQGKMFDIDNSYARDPRVIPPPFPPYQFSYNPATTMTPTGDRYWA